MLSMDMLYFFAVVFFSSDKHDKNALWPVTLLNGAPNK